MLLSYFIKSKGQGTEVLLLLHWKISPPLIVLKIKYHVNKLHYLVFQLVKGLSQIVSGSLVTFTELCNSSIQSYFVVIFVYVLKGI